MANTKMNGQIWIDKKSPYLLKYRYDDKTHILSVLQSFSRESSSVRTSGKVICYDYSPSDSKFREANVRYAKFPEDLGKTIGISYVNEDRVFLITAGELTIAADNDGRISNIFDEVITRDSNIHPGMPIYWYIGTISGSDGIYNRSYDSNSQAGLLTFNNPNSQRSCEPYSDSLDAGLNVSYDNLPQVGVIKQINLKDDKLKNIILDVRVSGFDSTLEWSWPKRYNHSGDNHTTRCGYIVSGDDQIASFTIAHGLFTRNDEGFDECFSNVSVRAIDDSGKEYSCMPTIINDYEKGTTSIRMKTLEDLRYIVTGSVNYNVMRG